MHTYYITYSKLGDLSYSKLGLTLLVATLSLQAQAYDKKASTAAKASADIEITNKEIKKKGNEVNVQMDLNLDKVKLESNKGLIYTPMIVNGEDTLKMPSVEVMGRKRYIYYLRNHRSATKQPLIVQQRQNNKAQTLHYSYTAPYSDWMKNSQFVIGHDACGCNQTLLAENILTPAGDALTTPSKLYHAYVEPKAEAQKVRQENGSARLNFRINKWDIVADLGNNGKELENIRKTLELVSNDPDVTITSIKLHGFASPDGKYANNEKLALNRTQALTNYLLSVYPIDKKLVNVSSTAEDWDGTQKYAEEHNIPQKAIALDIIKSNMKPDEKEKALAKKAPEAYQYILQNVWPSLRRTDYTIEYDVKDFNLEEARRVLKTRPQKLSLQEMYMIAQNAEKGSEEYNEVFEVAAKMFPEDKLANLNAAYAAIERGDKVSAEKYLQKAGNNAEADNARGCLAVLNEDYETAQKYFEQAASAGLKGAQENLDKMKKNM